MKKVFFILGAMLLTGSLMASVSEVVIKSTNEVVSAKDDPKKEQIKEDQLPQAVKKTLAGDEYKDWKIDVVYLVKGDKEFYRITLKKETNIKSVSLDKDGNVAL